MSQEVGFLLTAFDLLSVIEQNKRIFTFCPPQNPRFLLKPKHHHPMKNPSHLLNVSTAILSFLFAALPIRAQVDGSWKTDGNGDWSNAANWVSGTVPGGAESIVNFTNDITGHSNVTIDTTSRTVGVLNVGDSSHGFHFGSSGAALLVFDNGASAAELNLSGVSNTFGESPQTLSFSLNSSLSISNSSGSTQFLLREATSALSAGTSGTKTIQNVGTGSGEVKLNAAITNGTGVVAVEQNSATSMLTLAGASTFTGGVTVTAGRLRMGSSTAIGSGTLTLNGGEFSSASSTARGINNATQIGGNVTLGNAADNGALNLNGVTTLTANSTLTIESNVSLLKNIIGTYGITKVGSGTLTLGASSSAYSGTTTISVGTLVLNATGSIHNSPVIRVASGAGFHTSAVTGGFKLQSGQTLQNAGTFTGSLTALDGSTYAPGNSPGTATQVGDLALNTGSTFEWELIDNTDSGAGTNFDRTVFTSGGLDIETGVTANLVFNAGSSVDWTNSFWNSDQEWLVFSGASSLTTDASEIFTSINAGVDSLSMTLASVRSGASFSFANSGNDVYLQYTVPEPSTLVLFALGAAWSLGCRPRRRR